jgi:3-mercaptopyruvate sulfurtransferase SseA
MNAHGIKNTAALLGGWTAWREAGLPVDVTPVKPAAKPPVKK